MDKLQSPPKCYVFDSSSLIQLEKRQGNKGLKEMPEPPGKWLVVPSKVAKEVNNNKAPAETKHWIDAGRIANFSVDVERQLFMKIRVDEPLLADADIEGIVLAYHRKGTYVVEEGRARNLAENMGVRCINASTFLEEIQPRLF